MARPVSTPKIDLAVAETNTAYTNSQITTQLRLVYKGEVNYVEVSNMDIDLDRLRQPADGYMDEIHALRNTYQADMVSLILENAQSLWPRLPDDLVDGFV